MHFPWKSLVIESGLLILGLAVVPFGVAFGLVSLIGGADIIASVAVTLFLISVGCQWWITANERWQMFPIWGFGATACFFIAAGALTAGWLG